MLTSEQIAVQKMVELGQGTKAMRLWSDGLISWAELQSGRFDETISERRFVTVRDIAATRDALADAADDPEMRESLARNMTLDVLFTVASGAHNAPELANAALTALRVCSPFCSEQTE
jgi:hypothetical protein